MLYTLIKDYTMESGKKRKAGQTIGVDAIKAKELMAKGFIADPNGAKPKKVKPAVKKESEDVKSKDSDINNKTDK